MAARHSEGAAALVIGLGLGWLAGLSASPVIGMVLSTILGLVGGALVGLRVARRSEGAEGGALASASDRVSPQLLALAVLGLGLGAPAGVLARAHRWLEPTLEEMVRPWEALGVPRAEAVRRLMDRELPAASVEAAGAVPAAQAHTAGVLFSDELDECMRLQSLPLDRLRVGMGGSTALWARRLGDHLADDVALRAAMEAMCTP